MLGVVLLTVTALLPVQEVKQQNKVLFSVSLFRLFFNETKEETTFL